MVSVVFMGGLVASLLTVGSGVATTPPEQADAPAGITVEVVTVNGSGCPAGTGTATTSQGGSSLTVTSPQYYAWTGESASSPDSRKNCQLSLRVHRPLGWTYAVDRVESTGFAYLVAGASAVSRVSHYFQGTAATTAAARTFTAPAADGWQSTDRVEVAALVYAPCDADRNLNINTELRVSGDTGSSVTGFLVRHPVTTVGLSWKRCATG